MTTVAPAPASAFAILPEALRPSGDQCLRPDTSNTLIGRLLGAGAVPVTAVTTLFLCLTLVKKNLD